MDKALPLFTSIISILGTQLGAKTFTTVLSACAELGTPPALVVGKLLHSKITENMWDTHLAVAVMEMYTKCGDPQTALAVWKQLNSANFPVNSIQILKFL